MSILAKITAGAIFLVLFTAIVALLGGWWLMLTIGVAHAEWSGTVPTIGYWASVKIAAVLGLGPGIHRLRVYYAK